MQYNNFQEALQSALNSEIEGWKENNEVQFVKDLFDERSIYALEKDTEFLDCIPKDKYDDIVYELLTLLREYKNNYSFKMHEFIKLKENKKKTKNAKGKIKTEIKALKQARETLLSIFPSRITKIFSTGCPTEFKATLAFLDSAIADLEQEEFKIINRKRYYEEIAPTKDNLRNYIQSLRETYSIPSASMPAKQFIDAL